MSCSISARRASICAERLRPCRRAIDGVAGLDLHRIVLAPAYRLVVSMKTRSSRVNRSRRCANSRSSITSLRQRGAKRRAAVLLLLRQFLAEPRHRAIEMVQVEPGNAVDRIVLAPALGGTVGAAH